MWDLRRLLGADLSASGPVHSGEAALASQTVWARELSVQTKGGPWLVQMHYVSEQGHAGKRVPTQAGVALGTLKLDPGPTICVAELHSMLLSALQMCPHPLPQLMIEWFFDFPFVISPCVNSSLRSSTGEGWTGKQDSGTPKPLSKPMHTTDGGGCECARLGTQTRLVFLICQHTCSLPPSFFLSFLPTSISQAFNSHPAPSWAPAPYFNQSQVTSGGGLQTHQHTVSEPQ